MHDVTAGDVDTIRRSQMPNSLGFRRRQKFQRIYAPLTVGMLLWAPGDTKLQEQRRSQQDRLYQRVADYLEKLLLKVGLKIAA
jgi:hypothetical protein